MNKNDILKGLEIRALSSEGQGIAKPDGYTVFVKDTLPGDIVTVKVMKVKKNTAFARLVSIDEMSPDRVQARCVMARPCGGCAVQELDYDKQLAFKDDKVHNCLLRIGGIPTKVLDEAHEEPIGMETPWRYRNKAQYPIGRDKDGRIISGFYAGRTHHIVEAEECFLNPPEFSIILRTFLTFCEENGAEPYNEETGKGLIRHFVIRKGFATGEIMLMPVVTDLSRFTDRLRSALKEAMVGVPGLTTIVLNENPQKTNVILGQKTETIYGPGYITDRLGDLTFRISPLAFYQVNPVQALKIYEKALEYAGLKGDESIYDLCCGIGTISLFAAKKAGHVYGIESVPEAIEDARKNADINEISNADFICAKAEDYLAEAGSIKADAVILDPPRAGMERSALDAIVSAGPSRIVYISCDPATQARDIKVFLAAGYHLSRFVAADQFCHTSHVETVVLLTQRKPDMSIEITMDEKDLELTRAEAKATYKEITDYVMNKYGLCVNNLYVAQVKREFGIIERENYNKGKKKHHIPQVTPEKREAIIDALRFYKMIG